MTLPLTTRRFRSILCAVDFSAQSAKALRYAAATAGTSGGRVTAIYAVDPLLSAAAAVAYDSGALESRALGDLERFVARTIAGKPAASIHCVVQVGAAGPVVLAYARRVRASLIVMGTHGRRGAAKLFFGSTTEAVLRRFRGPVLAIPPRCRGPQPTWPGNSIVAAIDTGPHRRALLSAAALMAEAFGAWLSVAPAVPATATRCATRMIILPLASRARLRMLLEGSGAYRFVCASRSPVLVLRAGTRAGAVIHPSRAA